MIKKKLIIVLIISLLLLPIRTNAQSIASLQKELEAAQKKLNETNVQKAINKQSIDETNGKISEIQGNIKKAENTIEQKTEESKQLEEDIKTKNKEIEDLMRYYQISTSGSAMLEYIMGAKSITDLVYRLSITEQISKYNKKQIAEMNDMIAKNEQIKKELEDKKEELANSKTELNTQLTVLNEKQRKLAEEGLSESEAIKEMQKQIDYYKKIGCKTSETISACYSRIYSKSGSSGYLPPGTTFFRPTASGRMSSGYGGRSLRGSYNYHAAVDISTPVGTTVYSVAPGLVTKTIKSNSGGGNQIIIQHNINGNYYTSYYCHLSVISVTAGTVVTKDTVIGKSGNTGNSTGPHLHLGLAHGRWYVDYYQYYGNNGFVSHSFDPRSVITFPAIGSSYSNR